MKKILVVDFLGQPYLVVRIDWSTDVADLGEWNMPIKSHLLNSFADDVEPSCTISRARLRECKVLFNQGYPHG